MEFTSEFRKWIDEKIADALDENIRETVYGSELPYKLFEGENIDGSVTYNTYEAKEFIKNHWDDASEIAQYLMENFDISLNPFENPEKFHVCMLLYGAEDIINESQFVGEHWDEQYELTSENVAEIKSDIGIEDNEYAKKESYIDVLLIEPGKVPELIPIKNNLEEFQGYVGGRIEVVYPYEDEVGLICNEEGKIDGLPLNRAICDENGNMTDIIAGKFIIAGLSEENFKSLDKDLAEKYNQQFLHPETIIDVDGRITVIKETVPISETSLTDEARSAQESSKELGSKGLDNVIDIQR